MWPPSPASTVQPPADGISVETPNPVPGPATRIGASGTGVPGNTTLNASGSSSGTDRAMATKSLTTSTLAIPNRSDTSASEMLQSRLVSCALPPRTGPATAMHAAAGRRPVMSR